MGRNKKTVRHLKAHARRRAMQRFGMTLTTDQMREVVRDIQSSRAIFVDRQSNIVTRWVVHVQGRWVATVYDSARGMIRTVMPVEFLSQ
jgi:hypothetical protein